MTDPTSSEAPDPTDTNDPTALAVDLRVALRPLWRRFNALRSMSVGKVGILSDLDRFGTLAATELAARERISHQAVAAAVRELEDLGLVVRSADPADRRRTLITLTDAGRDRLTAEHSVGVDWLAEVLAAEFDTAERATLTDAIPLLVRLGLSDVAAPQ